jgi:ribonuclease HI
MNKKFIIYTDGSSRGNPGPGGWGIIIIENNNDDRINNQESRIMEKGGREENTTNNKMEMRAVIEGLKNTPENSDVEIHTDSEYVMKGATLWIKNWQKNNWQTKDKRQVLNKDLWLEILKETTKRKVEWRKVVGHSGHLWNERCDEIATSFADNKKIILYSGQSQDYFLFHSK